MGEVPTQAGEVPTRLALYREKSRHILLRLVNYFPISWRRNFSHLRKSLLVGSIERCSWKDPLVEIETTEIVRLVNEHGVEKARSMVETAHQRRLVDIAHD